MTHLQEIEAITEAIELVERAKGKVAMINSWAFWRLDRSKEHLLKQQAAWCHYHFLENPTFGDFRKVEDAVRGA